MSPGWSALAIAGLCLLCAACGFGLGTWRREIALDRAWDEGYEEALDDAEMRAVRPEDHPARPDEDVDSGRSPTSLVGRAMDAGQRWRRSSAAGALPPGMPAAPRRGPAPVTYSLDRPAPAGFYPELAALADVPRPGLEQVSGDALAFHPDSPAVPGHSRPGAASSGQHRAGAHDQAAWVAWYAPYIRLGEDMSWWFRAGALGVAEEWERFCLDLSAWSAKVAA